MNIINIIVLFYHWFVRKGVLKNIYMKNNKKLTL